MWDFRSHACCKPVRRGAPFDQVHHLLASIFNFQAFRSPTQSGKRTAYCHISMVVLWQCWDVIFGFSETNSRVYWWKVCETLSQLAFWTRAECSLSNIIIISYYLIFLHLALTPCCCAALKQEILSNKTQTILERHTVLAEHVTYDTWSSRMNHNVWSIISQVFCISQLYNNKEFCCLEVFGQFLYIRILQGKHSHQDFRWATMF